MDLTKNAILNLWTKHRLLMSESRRLSTTFSLNYSSQSSHQHEEQKPRELFRTGAEGESHKDNESVSDVGNRAHHLTEKMIGSMEGNGGMEEMKGKDSARITSKSGSIMEGPDDEDDMKKKLEKEAGGKPVDEDKGLDVNWRSIDETKPSSG